MTLFSSITTKQNGDLVRNTFFNELRDAGIAIETFLGLGYIGETQFTIANNQVSAANITGLLINPTLYRSFKLEYQIYRKTTGAGATELAESGIILGVYSTVAGTWEITQQSVGDSLVTLSILNTGQFQYTSSNITGTASVSSMKYKLSTIGVEA